MKTLILQGFDGVTRVCREVCRVCKIERAKAKKRLKTNGTNLTFLKNLVPLTVPQGFAGFEKSETLA